MSRRPLYGQFWKQPTNWKQVARVRDIMGQRSITERALGNGGRTENLVGELRQRRHRAWWPEKGQSLLRTVSLARTISERQFHLLYSILLSRHLQESNREGRSRCCLHFLTLYWRWSGQVKQFLSATSHDPLASLQLKSAGIYRAWPNGRNSPEAMEFVARSMDVWWSTPWRWTWRPVCCTRRQHRLALQSDASWYWRLIQLTKLCCRAQRGTNLSSHSLYERYPSNKTACYYPITNEKYFPESKNSDNPAY